MEISRREFLKLFGSISGAVALGGFGLNQMIAIPDELIEQAKNGPGIETWINTVCGQCSGGCGIKVRLIDGIPVYIKGNPIYPVNKGGMCPMGHGGLEVLFNPDRVKEPMKRIGAPGSGKWESVSWDEALEMISRKLVDLRNEDKSNQVAFLGYEEQGLMKDYISRFMQAYGSPNYYQYCSHQNDQVPYHLVQGRSQVPSYDFLNAKYILSFGDNFLEEGYSPVYYTKLYSHLRESLNGNSCQLIQIESRMSLTAANADRWIPIRPGAYGALALGIAYVLIGEKLYNAGFVKGHTFGFEDWTDNSGQKHQGFKNLVMGNYSPDKISEISGVPETTIQEIARDLVNKQPALVLGNQGTVANTNGTFSQMAVHSLNALLGNFQKEGGVFFTDKPPFGDFASPTEDAIAQKGNKQIPIGQSRDATFPLSDFSIESFTRNVLADQPYPLSILFLYKGNPLFQALNSAEFAEALTKIPLVVSFNSFIDETTEYADLILPDHTFLEKWDEISNVPSIPFAHVGIQKPVVKPFHDTRHTGEVLSGIAQRIGGEVAHSFPVNSYRKVIQSRMKGIYKSGVGAVVSEDIRQHWAEYLRQKGWKNGSYSSFKKFWTLLQKNGGWWNPIREQKRWKEIFPTPSHKFEFYSQLLESSIMGLQEKFAEQDSPQRMDLVLNSLNIAARGDSVFLPHHEQIYKDEEYPLYLTTFQLLTNRDGNNSNQPILQEMFGYTMRQYWRSWVEMHPATAEEHGIYHGDWVWIESSVGKIKVQAKIHPGVMPSVVSIPFGLGHTSYGRYAKGHGVNPNTIIKNRYDLINGKPALQATKVKISKIS